MAGRSPAAKLLSHCLIALAGMPALAEEGGRWTGQFTPYVWGSGMDGRLTPFTGAPTIDIDRSFSEVLEDVDASFFLTAYARRDRLVILGDLGYSKSSKDGLVPPGVPGKGRLSQRSLTLAAGWRVIEGEQLNLDLLAGIRSWRVRGEVEVPLVGLARSPSDSYTDPLLAARANISLAPRWSLITYADIGIFGGSEQTHQWLATVNYEASQRWAFSAGLRQLRVDYRKGGTLLDVSLSGPLVGASWRL
jgi:hypothetical protein